MTTRTTSAAQEWRAGWRLVLAGFVGFSFFSLMSASLGMFMEPLGQEFGWSRTLISSGVTIASVTTAILSPFFGLLIDRYGSRRVAMPGIVAASLSIAAFSLATASPTSWIVLWAIYAVISVSIKVTVWTASVASAFTAAQGLALGLVLAGTAAAQIVAPPLAHWLISDFGWRATYLWFGLGWGGVTLVLCWLFLRDGRRDAASGAQKSGSIRPDASGVTPAEAPGLSPSQAPGLSPSQAMRDPALWRIAATTLIMMLVTIGLLIHQVPILTAAGVARGDAAWLASLSGVAGITGKLITGALLDRFRPNWVAGLTMAVTTFAFLLLLGSPPPALIALAMIIGGYAAGTKMQITSYLTARYGGLKNYGAIFGSMHSLIALGAGIGPVAAGYVYDTQGSYGPFLIAGAIGCVVSAVLLFTLPAYPKWQDQTEDALA